MEYVLSILRKASNASSAIAKWLSIFYALVSTVIVLTSVFLRMAGNAPSWTEELARWLLVCIAFVGGSVALANGQHIGVTVLIKKVKKKWLFRSILQISNLLVITFLCYAFVYSMDAALKSADQVGDIIPVSVIWVKLHLPLGILFMLVHLSYYLVGIQLSDDPGEFMISR